MKLFLFIAAISCTLVGCSSSTKAASQKQIEPHSQTQAVVDAKTQQQLHVTLQTAVAAAVSSPISASGQLQLNEDATWRVGALTGGRISSLRVHLGDMVNAGALLAQMHSHEVHDSRADYRQASAELQRVELLAAQALRVRDRTNRLFALRAASREQVEAAETEYQSTRLRVTNEKAGLDRADSHLTEILEVPVASKPSSKADDDLVPIKAPASGTVIERLVTVGSVVSPGAPVVVLSNLSSLWLIAAVNEADLSRIRQGQMVNVSIRAYPNQTFKGRVFQLGERLDSQTRTLQVRVLVANAYGLLKPDMFATVEFSPPPGESAVHVPESAIHELRGKTVVFVQTAAGAFKAAEIEIGERTDGQVRVISGLKAGTPVVTQGSLLVKSQLLKAAGE